jgi:hypothetical protein
MGRRYITISVEVDIDDVLSELTDDEIEAAGFIKTPEDAQGIMEHLYDAASVGNTPRVYDLLAELLYERLGRVLVVRRAA